MSASARAEAVVWDDGGVALDAYFAYPPTTVDIAAFEDDVQIANEVLWDATDGQIYIRRVTMTDDPRRRRDAQIILLPGPGLAGSRKLAPVDITGNGVTVANEPGVLTYRLSNQGGVRVMGFQNYDSTSEERGITFGHELGHLVLGLYDEYPRNNTTCGGRGACIDGADDTNNCIMDNYDAGYFELCTDANHDLNNGDGPGTARCQATAVCGSPPSSPDTEHCERWSASTNQYEGLIQTESCWGIVSARFSFTVAPTQSVEPSADPAPITVIDNAVQAPRYVVILADRSGSMALTGVGTTGPLCVDANKDGNWDNPPTPACSPSRWTYVDQAVEMFAIGSAGEGFQVALQTFNSAVTNNVALQTLTSANLNTYVTALDAVTPTGSTGIGTAFNNADVTMDAAAAANEGRSIVLITDGESNIGPNPVPIATTLLNEGTNIFTIVTGADTGVGTIPVLDSENPRLSQEAAGNGSMVRAAMMQQWAKITGRLPLTPPLRYAMDAKLSNVRTIATTAYPDAWQTFQTDTKMVQTTVTVPAGTTALEAMVAEQPDRTKGLDVTFVLVAPNGSTFSSTPTATTAGMTATRRSGLMFARINSPAAGNWTMRVTAPGVVGAYRGQMQAFAKTRRTVAELWSRETAANNFLLKFNAHHVMDLKGLADVHFRAVSNVGQVINLTGVANAEDPYVYEATLNVTNASTSLWQVMATGRSISSTTADPGERLYPSMPAANSITIPLMTFSSTTSIQGVK
jgi:von Willebrand factor type A domain